ncbi:winged helix-turn-helix domain-containing protein [Yersinia enterocolitica]|uniref:winged helix-turn-helix domain-containing protein n=1 Tax=Yersinia enterocolitica TaxID=630 RepID=UPI00227BF37B|nr:winged helix-turn-helix domain-containing protein [Yersinia enterocolitica]MCY1687923.1 winged helix-turn-helix domain-containing protein [Yersinia enterocolitica]
MSSSVVLDKLKNVLMINNEAHALSKNEVLLLELLYLRAGAVIPRDELISSCWPDRVVSAVSLPVAIKHIRDVLRKATSNEVIKTHKSVGYSFQKDSLELVICSPVYEQPANNLALNHVAADENIDDKPQPQLSTKVRQKSCHNYAGYFMAVAVVIAMTLFMIGEEDIVSFTDSNTNNTIITNAPPALVHTATVLPKAKNSLIFKDDFGSVIVCNKSECKLQ